MIELNGTLKERVEEAIRLVCTEVTPEEVDNFCALYEKAGIKLFPASIEFFKKYIFLWEWLFIRFKSKRL